MNCILLYDDDVNFSNNFLIVTTINKFFSKTNYLNDQNIFIFTLTHIHIQFTITYNKHNNIH